MNDNRKETSKKSVLYLVLLLLTLTLGITSFFLGVFFDDPSTKIALMMVGIVLAIIAIALFMKKLNSLENWEFRLRARRADKKVRKSEIKTCPLQTDIQNIASAALWQGFVPLHNNILINEKDKLLFLLFSNVATFEELETDFKNAVQFANQTPFFSFRPRHFFVFFNAANDPDIAEKLKTPLVLENVFQIYTASTAVHAPKCFIIAYDEAKKTLQYNDIKQVCEFIHKTLPALDTRPIR